MSKQSHSYKLEVFFDEEGTDVHEKTSEGLTIEQARILVSVFEEYKIRMINYLLFFQKETDLNSNTKQ